MRVYDFWVAGKPQPEGSTRGFIRNGHVVIVHDNTPALMAWRNAVKAVAWPLFHPHLHEGPVAVRVSFVLHRPKSLNRWQTIYHQAPPDLDKLIRATNDGLTGVAWKDDQQVWRLSVEKHYAGLGEETGARIVLEMSEPREEADTLPMLGDWAEVVPAHDDSAIIAEPIAQQRRGV